MQNVETIIKKTLRSLKIASPTILAVLGSAGVVATSILSGKAAVKADKKIRVLKRTVSKNNGHVNYRKPDEKITPAEYIQGLWKIYVPPVVAGASTIACIMGSNALNKKQQASLISAYMMLENSYKEYKKKASELYGPEADLQIDGAIKEASSTSSENLQSENILTFYDSYGNRYFERTWAEVCEAEYLVNRSFVLKGYANLNDYYDFLGLHKIKDGSLIGWSMEMEGEEEGFTCKWIEFEHVLTPIGENDMNCFVIEFPIPPIKNYM